MGMNRLFIGGLAILAMGAASEAEAAANLVQNGNFALYSGPTSTASYQVKTTDNNNTTGGVTLNNWTNDGYTYLFQPGTADSTGAPNLQFGGTLKLWGPGDGSNNGLTATDTLSSTSSPYIALDGAYQTGPLYQTVTGLTVGSQYYIGFDWAVAQQYGFTGATTSQFLVNIGSSVPTSNGGYQYATNVVANPSEGFQPWVHVTIEFTATAASETLSFLANGTPSGGYPPFALLDNVSVTYAPEPATWAVMIAGFATLGFGGRLWRRGRSDGMPTAA